MPNFFSTALSLAKGAAQGALGSYGELRRSEGGPAPTQAAPHPAKSMLVDPYQGISQMGFRDRHSAISHSMLRSMVRNTPVVASIIQTRCNQIASFAQVQNSKFDLGFKVVLRDSQAQPSKAAQDRARGIENFLMQTGVPDGHEFRDDLATFLKKLTRDSLTIGHEAFEIVNNRKQQPAEFLAVDATTIRLAEMLDDYGDMDPAEIIRYVQVYEEQVIAEYTFSEMCFSHRVPTTDINMQGYGLCELEMLVDVISNLININEYNGSFFSNNSTPKGMINLRGTVTNDMLEGFRRHWYALLSGVENSWKTPIAATEGIDWIPMQASNKDMEMQQWNEIMVRSACAVFSISPDEIGFGMGPMGISSSLNTPTNVDKISEGRERGLNPILTHFARLINLHVVSRIDPDFIFEFRGLQGATREQQAQLAQIQVSTYKTIDEIRAEEDLPAMPDGSGKIISNPIWLQNQNMMQQQAQQQQMGPGGDQPPMDEGQGEDPDQEPEFTPDNPQGDEGDTEGDTGDSRPPDQLAASLTGPGRLGMPGLLPARGLNSGPGWFTHGASRH